MDDRNCSQNGDQVSTSPLKGSIFFIAGSFTERETEPVGVGPLMLIVQWKQTGCCLYAD